MSAPATHGPSITRATAVGPRLNLPPPSRQSVAVGSVNVGPTPQMKRLGRAGGKKNEGLIAPSPPALPGVGMGPPNKDGWVMIGTMVRLMRFQSWVSLIGTTGCTLRM